MNRKVSMLKFLWNIAIVAAFSGLFFGVIGLLLSGSVGLIYMAIIGFVFGGAGCFAMEISIIFETRSWESCHKQDHSLKLEDWLWFIKPESHHERGPKISNP